MSPRLPARPQLKRNLRASTIGDADNFIMAEDRAWLRNSRGLGVLLPRLDGQLTIPDLFEQVGTQLSPPEIIYLLRHLQDLDLLADGSGSPTPSSEASESEAAFWHALGVTEGMPEADTHRRQVRVHAASPAPGLQDLAA